MIDYVSDVRPLEGENVSDGDIAEILSALTVHPIRLADLENAFDFEGLATRHPRTGVWEGVLVDVINGGGGLGAGVAALFRHINKPRSVHLDTTDPTFAVQVASVIRGLATARVITSDQGTMVAKLGGGLKHGEVMAGEVAEARGKHETDTVRRAAVDAIRDKAAQLIGRANSGNAAAAAAYDAGSTAEEITQAGEAALAAE